MNEFGLSHVFKFLFLREKIIWARKSQTCEIPFASCCDCDKGARLHLTKKSALFSISDKVTTTLCVFHHFPLFNWVWWWSWIFSVKMQSNRILSWFVTSYWFSSGAPNHLTAVNNVTLELKSHVPNNHCSLHYSHHHEKVPFFRKMMCLVLPPNFMLQKILICSKESASS